MNSARYLNGAAAGDSLWSDNQGMGAVNLGLALDGTPAFCATKSPPTNSPLLAKSEPSAVSSAILPSLFASPWPGLMPPAAPPATPTTTISISPSPSAATPTKATFSMALSQSQAAQPIPKTTPKAYFFLPAFAELCRHRHCGQHQFRWCSQRRTGAGSGFCARIYNGTSANSSGYRSPIALISAESCTPTNGAADPGETLTLAVNLQNFGLRWTQRISLPHSFPVKGSWARAVLRTTASSLLAAPLSLAISVSPSAPLAATSSPHIPTN